MRKSQVRIARKARARGMPRARPIIRGVLEELDEEAGVAGGEV